MTEFILLYRMITNSSYYVVHVTENHCMKYPLASACILQNCMNVTLSSSFKLKYLNNFVRALNYIIILNQYFDLQLS